MKFNNLKEMIKKRAAYLLLGGFMTLTCGGAFAQTTNFSDDTNVSYAIGVLLAQSLQEMGVTVHWDAFANGLKQSLITGNASISSQEAYDVVQKALTLSMNKQKEENLLASNRFLEENKKKKGVLTTKSGLQYEVIEKGKGARPQKDSVVVVHYVGALTNGTVFDSSRERDEPATIPLEQVIPGWSEGIQLMHVGGKARFYIPPDLGYGEVNVSEEIPPNSVLIFDVELLEIES